VFLGRIEAAPGIVNDKADPLTGSSSDHNFRQLVNRYAAERSGSRCGVMRPWPRSVNVNIRCEILPSARRISVKRFGPSPSTPDDQHRPFVADARQYFAHGPAILGRMQVTRWQRLCLLAVSPPSSI
jgi:hypothetical protein